ncbi:MAG: carboxypeptidase regulatory-like domain-containing protein [Bryobacterales bacterium]|nr:carboxypeptidase regulatory-like domain-containing protein [Bryobacterales bacterium]
MSAFLLFLLAFASLVMAQEKGAVFGVVRDGQTQRPIEGARLYLAPYDLHLPDPLFPTLRLVMDSFIGFETTTDATGQYRFPDLPPHRYCLTAKQQGYWWTDDAMCQASMIRIRESANLQRNLTLDRAPTLRGRFLDSSTNTPITGLQLVVLQHRRIGGIRQWTTSYGMRAVSGPGEFELSPPRGEFYLEIVPSKGETLSVATQQDISTVPFFGRGYYPGVTDISMATPITLTAGEDRYLEIRLTRKEPNTMKIHIAGVPGDTKVQLALERRSKGSLPQTLAKGAFLTRDPIAMERLSEAEYTLIAWTGNEPAERTGAVVRFHAGDRITRDLKLELLPALTLQGVVHVGPGSADAPMGDLYFSMKAAGRQNPAEGYSSVKITASGVFEVRGLFPGEYQVYASAPTGWVVSGMRYGALDAIYQVFHLDALQRLELTLSRQFGGVSGSVTDGNGPMDNAMVVLVPEPMPDHAYVHRFPWTHLDESGRYNFTYVVPGRYRVIPFYGSTLELYHDIRAIRKHARGYQVVDVLPGRTSAGVDFATRR